MPDLTRGPHEPGVYWRRRAFVVLTALTLVFVIAEVLGGGSDGDDATPAASRVAAGSTPVPSTTASDPAAAPTGSGRKARRGPAPTYGPTYDPGLLAEPEGTCSDDDVTVTPSVDDDAVALRPVTITLSLRTVSAEACTWTVSPERLTVRISKGGDPLWTTQDCPSTIQTSDVVVRRAISTPVELTWNARESADDCPTLADWAVPGRYTIDAAALGGEPASSTFALLATAPETDSPETEAPGTGAPSGGQGPGSGQGSGGTDAPIDPPASGEPSSGPSNGGTNRPPVR